MASSAEKCVPLLPSPEEELDLLTTTCVAAGEIPLSYFNGDKALDVTFKTGNSPVSAADHAVNAMLMDRLTTARPAYGWLSEETLDEDPARRLNSARCFVVDPIDGTRGFINGSDQWCISAAIVEDNRPLVAVLVCPARGEVFTAIRGGGASLNGKPIKLEPGTDDAPLVGGPRIYIDEMDRATTNVIRRHGHVPSLAYRIAMVAAGKMDATFIKPDAHDWDIAAADLILSEAGGTLCDAEGRTMALNTETLRLPPMVAARPELLETMRAVVARTRFI